MDTHARTHTETQTQTGHTQAHTPRHTHPGTQRHTQTHTDTHRHIHIHTYTHTHVCTHIRTDTRKKNAVSSLGQPLQRNLALSPAKSCGSATAREILLVWQPGNFDNRPKPLQEFLIKFWLNLNGVKQFSIQTMYIFIKHIFGQFLCENTSQTGISLLHADPK